MEQKQFTEDELLNVWESIGKKNHWIRQAYDPPFDKSCLRKCNSLEELQAFIAHGNWCLGQGFYYKNICFINQIDGGDEWLAIKDNYDFESFTFHNIIKNGIFFLYMQDILSASKDECIHLRYKKTVRSRCL